MNINTDDLTVLRINGKPAHVSWMVSGGGSVHVLVGNTETVVAVDPAVLAVLAEDDYQGWAREMHKVQVLALAKAAENT